MYALVADICKKTEAGSSLKKILYGLKGDHSKDIPAIRSLTDTTLRNKVAIDDLINKTKLSKEIVFSEVWIARVLTAELVFGKKSYKVTDEISKKVYKYKKELKSLARAEKKKESVFVPRYCRINSLKCTKSEFHNCISKQFNLKEVGGKSELTYEDFLKVVKNLKKNEYIQDYHLADLYIFHPKANLTTSKLYQANQIILQDKASCLVAPLLAPTPGSLMLDMCAAPGFKTQHLSSISGTSGLILALDISRDRYNTLANTRINYDMTNVMTFNADALHLPEKATKCIEYILLDAPCSGSGVVQNYDYGTDNRKDKGRLNSLHNLQAYLLRSALTKYTSARRIVYSTCSLNEEENEAVVEELLDVAKENNFILANLKNHLQDFSVGLDKYSCGGSCIRLIPEYSCTNGFFIALFERANPPNPTPRSEFYKSLNDIIAGIRCRNKRKADEAEEKKVSEEISNVVTEQRKIPKLENGTSDKEQSSEKLSPSPNTSNANPMMEVSARESESSSHANKVIKSDHSDDSSSEGESTQEKQPFKPNIRVVQSALLRNPVSVPSEPNDKVESSSDSESSSSSSDSEDLQNKTQTNEDIKGSIKELANNSKQSSESSSSTSSDESSEEVENNSKSDVIKSPVSSPHEWNENVDMKFPKRYFFGDQLSNITPKTFDQHGHTHFGGHFKNRGRGDGGYRGHHRNSSGGGWRGRGRERNYPQNGRTWRRGGRNFTE